MSDAERLARALGPLTVLQLLRMVADRKPHTWDLTLILGPVRERGRRSVELLTHERTKTVDTGEIEEHNLTA